MVDKSKTALRYGGTLKALGGSDFPSAVSVVPTEAAAATATGVLPGAVQDPIPGGALSFLRHFPAALAGHRVIGALGAGEPGPGALGSMLRSPHQRVFGRGLNQQQDNLDQRV